MTYQLKTKDGRFAWVFEDGKLLCNRDFASEKEAEDWHFKTYGGLADRVPLISSLTQTPTDTSVSNP